MSAPLPEDHFIEPHEYNESYPTTKRSRIGHVFEGSARGEHGDGGNGNGVGAIAPTLLAVANDDAE